MKKYDLEFTAATFLIIEHNEVKRRRKSVEGNGPTGLGCGEVVLVKAAFEMQLSESGGRAFALLDVT